MLEKVVDIEAKASLQPPSEIREIDSRYSKGYKLAKNDQDKTNQEHRNRNKNKSTQNPTSANNIS